MHDQLNYLRDSVQKNNPDLLQKWLVKQSDVFASNGKMPSSNEVEKNFQLSSMPSSALDIYKAQLPALKEALTQFAAQSQEVKNLLDQLVECVQPMQEENIVNQLNSLLANSTTQCGQIKNQIDNLRSGVDSLKVLDDQLPELEIIRNSSKVIVQKFKNLIVEFQGLQAKYKLINTAKFTRQLKVFDPDITDQEVHDLAENCDRTFLQQRLKSQLLGMHSSVHLAIHDLELKQRDIKLLEQNVASLQQLYIELCTLIDYQGELIERIENNVVSAQNFTSATKNDLVEVEAIQKRKRKWKFRISMCVLIVLVICLIPVLLYLGL